MLAKQCWRLISSPNSLAGSVLKATYFPRCGFLDAPLGSSPSFVWKSFLWSRELVALGSRWRIGNGESTFVYRDRWIPRASSFKLLSPVVLDHLLTVVGLKSPSGGWNSNLVWSSFLPDDATLILNLPCSSSNHPDSLMWHADRAGFYTVKNGYWTAFSHKLQQSTPSCSSLSGGFWWKILWRLKIPSKIKLFCWKACNNWLPTVQVLRSCHLHTSGCCQFCRNSEESVLHAIWSCPELFEEPLGHVVCNATKLTPNMC
ncbi:hypothetical protein ACOSQ3_014694 [Xanthoceras sorbifolium]